MGVNRHLPNPDIGVSLHPLNLVMRAKDISQHGFVPTSESQKMFQTWFVESQTSLKLGFEPF